MRWFLFKFSKNFHMSIQIHIFAMDYKIPFPRVFFFFCMCVEIEMLMNGTHFQTKSHDDINSSKHPFSEDCFYSTKKQAVTILLTPKISSLPWWDRFVLFYFVLKSVQGLLLTGTCHQRKDQQIFFLKKKSARISIEHNIDLGTSILFIVCLLSLTVLSGWAIDVSLFVSPRASQKDQQIWSTFLLYKRKLYNSPLKCFAKSNLWTSLEHKIFSQTFLILWIHIYLTETYMELTINIFQALF